VRASAAGAIAVFGGLILLACAPLQTHENLVVTEAYETTCVRRDSTAYKVIKPEKCRSSDFEAVECTLPNWTSYYARSPGECRVSIASRHDCKPGDYSGHCALPDAAVK